MATMGGRTAIMSGGFGGHGPRRPGRSSATTTVVALAIVCATVITAVVPSTAQDRPDAGFIRVDARVTGDGPWTSWLGGEARRTVILTIENTSDQPVVGPEVSLRVAGASDDSITVPIEDLTPGARTTLDIDVALPRFDFGTHAVEGSVAGAAEPVPFRTETTHVPWLLLLLPTLVLAQVALVSLRNRARRRIHQPGRASERVPTEGLAVADQVADGPRPPAIASTPSSAVALFIECELDTALVELGRWQLDDDRFFLAVQQRARVVTRRVSDRFAIPAADMPELAATITTALLERAASPRRVPA